MRSDRRGLPTVAAPPPILLRRPTLVGLTLALSYGTGAWLTSVKGEPS